jgi:spore cortex formation protein SpoVR/YcgB (stage V sporulation)
MDGAVSTLLFDRPDWDFDTLKRTFDAIERIAREDLGLDPYPNQIEVITTEQMLDAYSSIGLPLMYAHWSFGKRFAIEDKLYRKGATGLAYEIVINSNPCISYMLEENSMTMQATVMAHAAFGHNHFFRHNYLFKQWTDAEGILDYLEFAKAYVGRCEERHGLDAVERVLDAAHALMDFGVDRYQRRSRPSLKKEQQRVVERREQLLADYNDLWRTVPGAAPPPAEGEGRAEPDPRAARLGLPEENLLYFLEKFSPRLKDWERELLRIVRNVSQYFYPQRLTKVMNEGCATFVHHAVMNRLYEKGLIDQGAMLEFIASHSAVVFQPEFDDRRFGGLNPYYLGFEMMTDIARMCTAPTEEDRRFLPDIAGNGDPLGTLRRIWAEYRDDSFILQFLSPALIRKLRLFALDDDPARPAFVVDAIHNERGYARIRKALATQFDPGTREPDIQVTEVDLAGDRRLVLTHAVRNGIALVEPDARAVVQHISTLWGHRVELVGADAETGARLYAYDALPRP